MQAQADFTITSLSVIITFVRFVTTNGPVAQLVRASAS